MKIFKGLILLFCLCFSFTILSAQISPYQSGIIDYSGYNSITPDVNLQYSLMCQKHYEKQLIQGMDILRLCGNNNRCITDYAFFNQSSWLDSGVSTYYNGKGASFIKTKQGEHYVFKYIPANILKQWQSNSSPGQFYHRYIKYQYRISDCINYEP